MCSGKYAVLCITHYMDTERPGIRDKCDSGRCPCPKINEGNINILIIVVAIAAYLHLPYPRKKPK